MKGFFQDSLGILWGFFWDSQGYGSFEGADEEIEGFVVAPLAAVPLNSPKIHFEGILWGFFGDSQGYGSFEGADDEIEGFLLFLGGIFGSASSGRSIKWPKNPF